MLLSRLFTFKAYADYFSFPWLKFQVNAPSIGKAFLAELDMIPERSISMYFRCDISKELKIFPIRMTITLC